MRLRHLAVGAVLAVTALAAAAPAAASIAGPCNASVAGVNVANRSGTAAGDAIHVQKNAIVPVTMGWSSGISHLKITVSMAGFHWTVTDQAASGTSWARSVDVGKYAKWGAGLYQVTGVSTGKVAGTQCSGTALVKVGGNPLATTAGVVALVLAVLGAVGLVAVAAIASTHLNRATFSGLGAGLLLALGIGTLLQEYALVYPTRGIALATLCAGGVAGLLLPSVVRAIATGHTGFHRHATGH